MNISDKINLKNISTAELQELKKMLLSSLPQADQIIRGSLITRSIKCGKPNCHCATGDGHPSLYLSSFYHGKTHMDYVPAIWEPWIRKSIENHEVLQNLLSQLTELNLELFRRREAD